MVANQLKPGKSQDRLLVKAGQKHTHKADGSEILNTSNFRVIIIYGYLKMIPVDFIRGTIRKRGIGHDHIGNVRVVFRAHAAKHRYAVLIIFFILIQCIVAVEVFRVGQVASLLKTVRLDGGIGVALRPVIIPVSGQYTNFSCFKLGSEVGNKVV